jgi:hypothetical protein
LQRVVQELEKKNKEELEEYLEKERKKLKEFYNQRYHSDLRSTEGNQENNFLKEKRLNNLKNVFNIDESYVQGEAFDKEKQEERKRINKEMKVRIVKEQKNEEKRKRKLEELELLEKLIEEDKKLDERIEEKLRIMDK